jgi:hypothetical protein
MVDVLTLNAYTNGFHGWLSTTGIERPRYVRWVYDQAPWAGITIFEDAHMYEPVARGVRTRARCGWLVEPRSLRPENYSRALGVRENFDAIYTYDEELLDADPNRFQLCPRMGTHVHRGNWGLREKSRGVALLASQKNATPGHRLRHDAVRVYGSAGRLDVYGLHKWADKVPTLAPYRFAVVIECEQARDLFTDHLLDVIALGCVPLYCGAPNIADWLNPAGILPWSTLDELGALLARCTPELYAAMLPAATRNLAALAKYRLAEDWLFAQGAFLKWM